MAETNNVKKKYQFDGDGNTILQEKNQAIADVKAAAPVQDTTYDKPYQDMYDRVMNQEKFTYDLNGDALWQQYKDQYTNQGKLAMMDTMGQAAALTGGYGSSYAQNVGQQAYQGYLQQLNDRVPELYQLALDKYNNDYALLKDQFNATAQMKADKYGEYQDKLNQHNIELDRAQSNYDTAYDREYNNWYTEQQLLREDEDTEYNKWLTEQQLRREDEDTAYNKWLTEEQLRREEENTAYNKKQDAYDRLANLISTGYSPSKSELAAAGMSVFEAAHYAKIYKDQTGEGEITYGKIMDECREIIRNGASKSEVSKYLREAYENGHISKDEWDDLKETFVPARQTY